MQLQPHGIGGEATAGQACQDDRVLSLLDVLLRRTPQVVEQCHPFRRPAHFGHNKPDARIQLTKIRNIGLEYRELLDF